eukprot:s92_g22.t1
MRQLAPWFWLVLANCLPAGAEPVQCQEYQGPDNKTCVLKDNLHDIVGKHGQVSLEWDGDVILPAGHRQSFTINSLVFNIAGILTFQKGSSFFHTGDLRISAKGFRFEQLVSVRARALQLSHESCEQGMEGDGFELQAFQKLILSCPGGTINFTGTSDFNTPMIPAAVLYIRAKSLYLEDTQTMLKSFAVQLWADEELHLRAEPEEDSSLNVHGKKVILGWKGGSWILQKMTVVGGSVQFAPDHRVEVRKTRTCRNQALLQRDPCEEFLNDDQSPRLVPEALDNHSVDFAVLAEGHLDIGPRVRLVGAAPFLCSGSALTIQKMAVISSDGRGCRAGEGRSRGETRSFFLQCGSAGGSNVGQGGSGAKLLVTKQGLTACAQPGRIRRAFDFSETALPMAGAAGGGCAVPEAQCRTTMSALTTPVSSGGGLVWLSAHTIILHDGVRISASGLNGGILRYGSRTLASGGGAGGQIIAISNRLEFLCGNATGVSGALECEAPRLIARGGHAQCIAKSPAVGGAGGGGFIGLKRNNTNIHEIELDVAGGELTSGCADALPQKGRNLIIGRPGLATSLVPCQEGHAGPFCSPCPVGSWGDGENPCQPCNNKEDFAVYSADAWPNSSCLYECDLGLPDVKINPKCISNMDFAMSCFGGRVGFATTLACPLIVFILARGIHWLRRRRAAAETRLQDPLARPKLQGLPVEDQRRRCADLLPPGWATAGGQRKSLEGAGGAAARGGESAMVGAELYQLLSVAFRVRRAKQVSKLCCNEALWASSKAHALRFGCDDAAIAGHLDIFDLTRSLVDWAPAGAEQLFVARGLGTWEAPFELNVADPLLLGLAQTPEPVAAHAQAAQAIYSLVCTFNLFSRLVPHSELMSAGAYPPALQLLDREVRRCSLRMGQAAAVQVLRLAPVAAPGSFSGAAAPSLRASFSELVRQIPAAEEGSVATTTTDVDWKLCLVFPHGDSGDTEMVRNVQGLLVAPAELSDLKGERQASGYSGMLDSTSESLGSSTSLLKEQEGSVSVGEWIRSRVEHLKFQMLSPWVCSIQSQILPFLVSVLFLTLILLDGMVCALVAYSLWRLCGRGAFCLWLLLPTPFAPALSTAVGLASVLMHQPSRLHSQLALRSALNTCLVGLPLLLQAHARAQPLLCLSLFLNLAICYAAAVYASLEAFARDVAIAEDSGNASLRGQVQSEPMPERSRGQDRSEIAMTVFHANTAPSPTASNGSPNLRVRLSTYESEAESVNTANPF